MNLLTCKRGFVADFFSWDIVKPIGPGLPWLQGVSLVSPPLGTPLNYNYGNLIQCVYNDSPLNNFVKFSNEISTSLARNCSTPTKTAISR